MEIMDGYVLCYNVKRCKILATHAKKTILESTNVHMQSYKTSVLALRLCLYQTCG